MTNTNINYSEPATIATAIRTYVKTNHPECKFSVTRRNFNVITVALMEAPFEVFTAEAKQQAGNDGYYGFELGKGDDYHRTGKFADSFTDEAHAVLNDVQEFMNSLNYNNSDYYTDYFDRGFYDYLKVGKWDKPFKSTAVPAPSKEEKTEEPAPAQEQKETAPEKSIEAATAFFMNNCNIGTRFSDGTSVTYIGTDIKNGLLYAETSNGGRYSVEDFAKGGITFEKIHGTEPTEIAKVLPEMPAAASDDASYTANIHIYAGEMKKENFVTTIYDVSLADFINYVDKNSQAIADAIGATPVFNYFIHKNNSASTLISGYTQNFKENVLSNIKENAPDEYPAILAAISASDNEPDPTEPTIDLNTTESTTAATPAETSGDVSTPQNYCQGSSIQTVKDVLKSNSPWLELVAEKHFETGETNLIYANGNDIITYYFDRNGGFVVADYAEGIAGAVRSDFAQITEPAVSPIDETAAKRGHESYSTSDYKPGSATAAYNAAVASVRAAADEVREHIPEEYRGELDKLVNRYAVKLADWTNRKNRTDASCPSWFITGAAKYPHKKHERQMQQLDKLFKEYDQIKALEERIKNFAYECKHRPIKAGDVNAADKLRAKVEELTALQNQMKQANAESRKRGESAPYGAYTLSNNRQNLKRYADRLAAIEKAKTVSTAQTESIEREGFRIVRNTDIMRLQILFNDKPDEQTRTLLKSNGFKWAPSQKAWQRQLTANAERAARSVAASL